MGELVVAARQGLWALSVGVGLSVVHASMEAEVSQVVGPNGKHNPDRTAKRLGRLTSTRQPPNDIDPRS